MIDAAITCIVVDDQPEAVEILASYISKLIIFKIKLATTDPIEALNYTDIEAVDIIFLDIQMPDISGMDFIDSLRVKRKNKMPKIIFITGYDEYAIPGYEYGVSDYLLKPISFIKFKKCVDRITEEIFRSRFNEMKHPFFFVETDKTKIKISHSDLVCIEGARNYIYIYTDTQKIVTLKTMIDTEKLLPGEKFIRVHKSFIVAVDKIKAYVNNNLIVIYKNQEKEIPVGATYKDQILPFLGIKK